MKDFLFFFLLFSASSNSLSPLTLSKSKTTTNSNNRRYKKNDNDNDNDTMIRKQLGYLPTNFISVSAWKLSKPAKNKKGNNNHNHNDNDDNNNEPQPVSIKTYPLHGGAKRRQTKAAVAGQLVNSPFPTLYWLTCPAIAKAVANLERRGYIQRYETRLRADPALAARLVRCHEEYAHERWYSLTEEDRTLLSAAESSPSILRMQHMMKCSGISGTNFTTTTTTTTTTTNTTASLPTEDDPKKKVVAFSSIKCLHAHYAHFRSTMHADNGATINPVGEMIHHSLETEFPDLEL